MHRLQRGAAPVADRSRLPPASRMVSTPLRRASDLESIPIGTLPRPGRSQVRDAVWSLDAVGLEKDQGFHFACRQLIGDGMLVARVTAVGGPSARAGLLIRSGRAVTDDTRAVWLQLSEAGELRAVWRQGLGASRVEAHDDRAAPPCWLKLVRRGNVVHGFASFDGRDWSTVASVHFHALPSAVLVGLAACSGTADGAATAVFDHVRLADTPARARHPHVR